MSYRVQVADDGLAIRAEVTASNALGSVSSRTAAVKVGADRAAVATAGAPAPTSGGTVAPGTTSKGATGVGGSSPAPKSVRTVDIGTAKVSSKLRDVTVPVSTRRAGTLTVTITEAVKGGRRVGQATRKVKKAGKVSVTVPLSKSARKSLARGRSLRTRVVATVKVSGGGKASRSEKATLKRPRRR